MVLFKFTRFARQSTPVVATNMSLDSWCHQSHAQSTQLIHKVEMCTALCAGEDAWDMPLGENHHHTLLRVFLTPTRSCPGGSTDILLIERILSTGGAYHSVTPIAETFPTSGTLFHPDVHDRICNISCGPSTKLAHQLVVERTLTLGDRTSESRLTLAQFARILAFVSQSTRLICDGGDCRFQSRSFAFTCLAALAPRIPPRKSGERVGMPAVYGAGMVDDSVFELSAEAFLGQVPWLVRDPASIETLKLIGVLKDEPRERVRTRLYH